MPRVTYFLNRENYRDPDYGTGAWAIGETKEITPEQWARMAKHHDMWCLAQPPKEQDHEEVPTGQEPEQAPVEAGQEPETVLTEAEGGAVVAADEAIAFGDMTDDQVKAFALAEGLKVDGRLRGDNLKAAVTAAYEANLATA